MQEIINSGPKSIKRKIRLLRKAIVEIDSKALTKLLKGKRRIRIWTMVAFCGAAVLILIGHVHLMQECLPAK